MDFRLLDENEKIMHFLYTQNKEVSITDIQVVCYGFYNKKSRKGETEKAHEAINKFAMHTCLLLRVLKMRYFSF